MTPHPVPKRFLIIAGEPSGDQLAAEWIHQLRRVAPGQGQPYPLEFFGVGGPKMREAGVQLVVDMTQLAVVGLVEVVKHYASFRKIFHQLLELAWKEKPDAILLVDFSGFNRRFAQAIRKLQKSRTHSFLNWTPQIIYYISPQVWASRPKRSQSLARDIDLLLSIFPFEKDWYAKRHPNFKVEYVGHPLVDRLGTTLAENTINSPPSTSPPQITLLPGSRRGEIQRHWPVFSGLMQRFLSHQNLHWTAIFPDEALLQLARTLDPNWDQHPHFKAHAGGLREQLENSTFAIASTGTVTMECAFLQVPTLAIYRTSWTTYQIGKRIIQVPYLAMPNILSKEEVFPEYIQDRANQKLLEDHVKQWLDHPEKLEQCRRKLETFRNRFGPPGASHRAALALFHHFTRQSSNLTL